MLAQFQLQALKEEHVPLENTQLGVAAKQMAVATANNMSKLNRNTRDQLLKSVAEFDMAEQGATVRREWMPLSQFNFY